ncbi:unnamed protein product, partial [Didymodactylos carnosus]
MRLKRYYIM